VKRGGEGAVLKGGSIGRPDCWLGAYIFRSRVSADRVSGTGLLVRVRVQVIKCKGANAEEPRAKVAYESIEYGVLSIGRGTISGGGKILNSMGDREPDD
jgi:hypothetical protein